MNIKKLFEIKDFVRLWLSQILSQISINLMNFYVLTQVFAKTQSTTAVALIWIAGAVPALIFGPFSGPIVDSVSRRKAIAAMHDLPSARHASAIVMATPLTTVDG